MTREEMARIVEAERDAMAHQAEIDAMIAEADALLSKDEERG
jgi:hypothetical protein